MTLLESQVQRRRLCALVAIVAAATGGTSCAVSGSYMQLTYRATDVMLGTMDITTLEGSSVERKSVQKLCSLEFSSGDVSELVTAFEAVPPGSVPADASPGAICNDCTRFELDAKLMRAGAADLRINAHWLKQPSESVVHAAFVAFVAKLDDMQMRVQTQGTCVAPPI